MARPLRLQFEGALYHLVVRAINRQPFFRDHLDRRRYLELLSRYRGQFGCRLYAYVLMRCHVHLLLETPRGNVSKVMQCLGTSYTSYFNRRHRRRGTLIEGRYKSYLIDKESTFLEITRYIHRDHFQLSLKRRRDYPWSSYRIYLGRGASDLLETEPVLSRFGRGVKEQRRHYQEFVEIGSVRGLSYPRGVNSQPMIGSPPPSSQNNEAESPLRKAERIVREVNHCLGSYEAMGLQERRKRTLVRHVAMYLIRKQTTLPLRSIGEILGVKAPAVALAIGKVEQLLKREDFSNRVKGLLKIDGFSASDRAEEYSPPQRELANGTGIT
ncbi:MAG: transposase [Deltaproteobacteria bacterium]|nr:transposase [Deltaproteobacteria bacterium]